MTVFVRLATERDFDAIVELSRQNCEETKQGDVFSPRRVREILAQYLETANPTIFVVDDKREVIGFLVATMNLFDHRDGFFTCQKVLFVTARKRGSRAAILLMKELLRWSEDLGAAEVIGGNDNSFNSERTAGFLEHFGFRRVGFAMSKRLG